MSEVNVMLKYFEYRHLPANLQTISKQFHDLAKWMDVTLPEGREKYVVLRKLLECKEISIRVEK